MSQQVLTVKNRIAKVTPVCGGFEVYVGLVHRDGEEQALPHFKGTCCKTFKTHKEALAATDKFFANAN